MVGQLSGLMESNSTSNRCALWMPSMFTTERSISTARRRVLERVRNEVDRSEQGGSDGLYGNYENDADLHRVYDSDMGCLFDLQRSHTINFQCCFIRVGPAVACHTFCGRLFVWTYFLAGLLRPLTSSIMEFNLPDGKYGQCLRKEVRQDCTDASGRVPGGRPRVYTDCPQVEM